LLLSAVFARDFISACRFSSTMIKRSPTTADTSLRVHFGPLAIRTALPRVVRLG